MGFRWLKHLVPAVVRPMIRRNWTRLLHWGGRFYCPICASDIRRFETSGQEPDFRCPVCASKPPHRLALKYFELHPELFVMGESLIHVAPEPELGKWLCRRARKARMKYHPGGLDGVGEQHLDLRQLPFPDGTVKFLYCCHVLNMVEEDRQAMAEVFRVIHPHGVALLQVPAFFTGSTTLEPESEAERIAAFNDPMMYRCYTDADYVARLNESGFFVEHFRAESLPSEMVQKSQLKREVLHICLKNRTRN